MIFKHSGISPAFNPGIELDKLLRYYSMIDMTKMTVMDALASSYIEIKCDEFQVYSLYKDEFHQHH